MGVINLRKGMHINTITNVNINVRRFAHVLDMKMDMVKNSLKILLNAIQFLRNECNVSFDLASPKLDFRKQFK